MIEKSVLPGGVRVVTEFIPHVRSVSLGFWYGTGSRDEPPAQSGIAHFVEHMMFKGTPRRTARQIAEAIDMSGGQINAFTTKEHTCYYVRVLDEHLAFGMDVLADMLLNSLFAAAEIEREKRVIIEEIKMYEDTPDEAVHDLFAETLLGTHPLGRGVLGTEDAVGRVSRGDLQTFVAERYTADRLVVAAAGRVEHLQVVDLVAAGFSGLPSGRPRPAVAHPESSSRVVIVPKETEQVHLVLGGYGPGQHDPAKYAAFVLDALLGGGVSSRLFQELREERGLVYETYSFESPFRDGGMAGVYAGTSPENLETVVELVLQQLNQLCEGEIGDGELQRAKEQLKGSLMLGLESTTNRMSRFAKAELADEPFLTADELIARIDAVSVAELVQLSRRLWQTTPLCAAAIGPVPTRLRARVERRIAAFGGGGR